MSLMISKTEPRNQMAEAAVLLEIFFSTSASPDLEDKTFWFILGDLGG